MGTCSLNNSFISTIFPKKYICDLVNLQFKVCFKNLVQNNINHLTSMRMVTIKKTHKITNVATDVEKLEPLCTLVQI